MLNQLTLRINKNDVKVNEIEALKKAKGQTFSKVMEVQIDLSKPEVVTETLYVDVLHL